MKTLFVLNPTEINERPSKGFTYIYIYSCKNLILYVGQTVQSIDSRFVCHLSDNSGARYANLISYFQIKSEYANYAEGYLAKRLKGICQRTVPNYENYKDKIPEDVKNTLINIGNKIKYQCNFSKANNSPLFYHTKKTFCEENVLRVFDCLLKEENGLLATHFSPSFQHGHNVKGINLIELSFKKKYPFFVIYNELDYRPFCFIEIKNAHDLKEIKNIKTNFPLYGLITSNFYEKYEKFICNITDNCEIGILIDKHSEILLVKEYKKPLKNESLDVYVQEVTQWCKKNHCYYAQLTPYKYFQCS